MPTLPDLLRDKLRDAAAPLRPADAAKGLPKPRSVKADAFRLQVRDALDEEVRQGRLFRHPSGKGGEPRYWSRDERPLLRQKLVESAAEPLEWSKLQKALGKGLDAAFAEAVLRELVAEGRMFEYPPKTKRGKPLFGASPPPPPPPPLETKPHKAKLTKLAADCRKLLAAAGVSAKELLETLSLLLGVKTPPTPPEPPETPPAALNDIILQAVDAAPVLSLADLRIRMPPQLRGRAFDEAVLRLADEHRVVLSRDADPASFTAADRAKLVCDGDAVYTTISPRR